MNKVTLPIETPRLILRKYLVDDVGDILEFSQAADFWLSRNLDWEVSEEGIRQYFEARLDIDLESYPDWFNLLIELKSESTVIGNIGIGIKDKEGKQAERGWLAACKSLPGNGNRNCSCWCSYIPGLRYFRATQDLCPDGKD